ncbi:MAG: chemotaxis protein CheW [Candidatus Delongbacteria bacterium]|nr:chemotaxis protein CheW [Candidatus Delongbacteria bacterium]MBN2834416.1 chemotaxis protein CheW [Candidatus Delongbacteria bacterium]
MSKSKEEVILDIGTSTVHREKYVSFLIGNENFGFRLLDLIEIYSKIEITRVPNIPDYILGVMNLRGKVVPVISLRSIFKMERKEYDNDSRIIIVNYDDESEVGILVDKVDVVIEVKIEDIETTPVNNELDTSTFIKGVYNQKNGSLLTIIDLKKLLEKK